MLRVLLLAHSAAGGAASAAGATFGRSGRGTGDGKHGEQFFDAPALAILASDVRGRSAGDLLKRRSAVLTAVFKNGHRVPRD